MQKTDFIELYLAPEQRGLAAALLDKETGDRPLEQWKSLFQQKLRQPSK